jgi:hypothetical protein
MDADVNVTDVRDQTKILQGGVLKEEKRVTFYIGRFGPFYETFPREEYSMAALEMRVALLKANLPTQTT